MGQPTPTDSDNLDAIPMHDSQVLPHDYEKADLEELFPRASAPDGNPSAEEKQEEI